MFAEEKISFGGAIYGGSKDFIAHLCVRSAPKLFISRRQPPSKIVTQCTVLIE